MPILEFLQGKDIQKSVEQALAAELPKKLRNNPKIIRNSLLKIIRSWSYNQWKKMNRLEMAVSKSP